MNKELEMNPNQLVAFIGKPCAEFTKADIIHYIQENGIRMVNFMYPAGDGRLKTLNFVIKEIQTHMKNSSLRNLVEERSLTNPQNVSALKILDKEHENYLLEYSQLF